MTSITAIFFDLDGTLVDSSIGIHNAFTYTFKELGVPSPDAKTIRGFMGPPLESSFATCLPKEQISKAVQIYRSYYKAKGIHEAQLISVVVAFLYYVITEYFKNSYIDCILFLSLLISHLIWDYYFLPIEILVALSGANLLSRFFKKKRSQ